MARFLTCFDSLSAGFLIHSMRSIPKVAVTFSFLCFLLWFLIAIWFGQKLKVSLLKINIYFE